MTNAQLSAEQTIKLLKELATNDVFRESYADAPAVALLELGVPRSTVDHLSPACLAAATLASKEAFQDAYLQAMNSDVVRALSMAVPNLRIARDVPRILVRESEVPSISASV